MSVAPGRTYAYCGHCGGYSWIPDGCGTYECPHFRPWMQEPPPPRETPWTAGDEAEARATYLENWTGGDC